MPNWEYPQNCSADSVYMLGPQLYRDNQYNIVTYSIVMFYTLSIQTASDTIFKKFKLFSRLQTKNILFQTPIYNNKCNNVNNNKIFHYILDKYSKDDCSVQFMHHQYFIIICFILKYKITHSDSTLFLFYLYVDFLLPKEKI